MCIAYTVTLRYDIANHFNLMQFMLASTRFSILYIQMSHCLGLEKYFFLQGKAVVPHGFHVELVNIVLNGDPPLRQRRYRHRHLEEGIGSTTVGKNQYQGTPRGEGQNAKPKGVCRCWRTLARYY